MYPKISILDPSMTLSVKFELIRKDLKKDLFSIEYVFFNDYSVQKRNLLKYVDDMNKTFKRLVIKSEFIDIEYSESEDTSDSIDIYHTEKNEY